MINLNRFFKIINSQVVKITLSNGRYEFTQGGKVIHTLAAICTNKDRLVAHWDGLIENLQPICVKAQKAIKAAEGVKNWGRDAARKFAKNNGISPRLFRIACQCEAAKNF